MGFKAEWETQKAILLALPHIFSDWEEYIDEVRFCYLDIIKNIILYEKVLICIDPRDESALRFLVEHFNKSKLDSLQSLLENLTLHTSSLGFLYFCLKLKIHQSQPFGDTL